MFQSQWEEYQPALSGLGILEISTDYNGYVRWTENSRIIYSPIYR